ncbi:MAG TPA: glycosyltransferase family 2 protein [Candidatus Merdicola faecigallinarum]|uniref:Glycosyltransferase family 2 protein n=1 Tax=Candidatus Merdicola faecigallinarum TaxID=2840862 RepID=A0A9D1M1N7_9FIRM|nr:glycosyltransferase family 2 protein [Candidatus Merdicola faecigallinarum]
MKKISIVIPMYYEEEVAEECYQRISNTLKKLDNYDYELIFINDGSQDKTQEILENIAKQDKKAKIITFSRNFGHQCAVTAGIKYVTGDCVVIIDADLQDPPEVIPEMLKLWEQGNEVIYGKRKSRKGESKFKLLSAKMFYRTLDALSDVKIPMDTGDFRLVDRKVIDVINSMPEHNKFLRGLYSWVGFKQIPYEYERQERYAGKTKYPLKKMLKLASDGIISFSTKPLKLVGYLGIITIVISIALLIYTLISYIFSLNNLTAGWTSIMVAITLFSGVQLVSIWLISEYIARIYDETKNRPQYIIRDTININEKEEK